MDIPELFLERMKKDLGDGYPAFLESLQQDEVKALRINPVKGMKSLPDELEDLWHLGGVPWEDTGFYYETEEGVLPPGKHPLHEAGAYYIQEPSAMYPVSLLGPMKNERVLDLCASPGGKSTQIVSYMGNTGLLVSNEIIRSRALTLSSNIERMGAKNTVVTNMEPARLSAALPAFFDRVLVDAPCSGEGMMRRGDAARENWSVENVLMCASRQREILDEAAKCVRPGGKLVYSTCTFSKEEDEDNVQGFLSDHPDFELIKSEKLFPHRIRGEGHFAALFERKGNEDRSINYRRKKNTGSPAGLKSALGFLEDFLSEDAFLRIDPGRVIEYKDSLYLIPEGLADLKGLSVIRPGLCLGSMKKERFEPSHSLAMTLLPDDAKNVCTLDYDSSEALAYLSGISLDLTEGRKEDMADGWCLVTIGRISAGLGKKTGNTIKNHYPKGLRRMQE